MTARSAPPPFSGLGDEFFEAYPAPTLVVDADVRVLEANGAARGLLGLDGHLGPALLKRGGELLRCIHADAGPCGCSPACEDCVIRNAVGQAIAHRQVRREATVLGLRRGDGVEERNFLVSAAPLDGPGETRALVTLEDVTDVAALAREVSAAERKVHGTQARLAAVVENLAEGVIAFTPGGEIVHWNRAALDLHGLRSVDEAPRTLEWLAAILDLTDPAGRPLALADWPVSRILRGERLHDEEAHARLRGATRTAIWLHSGTLATDDGEPSGVGVLTIRDVTEKRALRAQLAVGSRLASLGTLVAGVAHEINNPLASVTSGIASARQEIRAGADPREALESLRDAEQAAHRIAGIVRDLFLFARPDAERRPVRLMDPVNGAMRWLPSAVGRAATIEVENLGAPEVLGSEGQLEQVLVNLVVNAAHAAPSDRQAHVTVRVGPGRPGTARIDVEDDGVGMTADVVERVFDPFFTTRDAGKGMGLGLPICHAIVVAHGGTIAVESAPGKGTTVRVELPALPAAVEGPRDAAPALGPGDAATGRT